MGCKDIGISVWGIDPIPLRSFTNLKIVKYSEQFTLCQLLTLRKNTCKNQPKKEEKTIGFLIYFLLEIDKNIANLNTI